MKVRTKDHPQANGRKPEHGEKQWCITLPLENGEDIVICMGQRGRDFLFGMLIADCADSGEPEPADTPA